MADALVTQHPAIYQSTYNTLTDVANTEVRTSGADAGYQSGKETAAPSRPGGRPAGWECCQLAFAQAIAIATALRPIELVGHQVTRSQSWTAILRRFEGSSTLQSGLRSEWFRKSGKPNRHRQADPRQVRTTTLGSILNLWPISHCAGGDLAIAPVTAGSSAATTLWDRLLCICADRAGVPDNRMSCNLRILLLQGRVLLQVADAGNMPGTSTWALHACTCISAKHTPLMVWQPMQSLAI